MLEEYGMQFFHCEIPCTAILLWHISQVINYQRLWSIRYEKTETLRRILALGRWPWCQLTPGYERWWSWVDSVPRTVLPNTSVACWNDMQYHLRLPGHIQPGNIGVSWPQPAFMTLYWNQEMRHHDTSEAPKPRRHECSNCDRCVICRHTIITTVCWHIETSMEQWYLGREDQGRLCLPSPSHGTQKKSDGRKGLELCKNNFSSCPKQLGLPCISPTFLLTMPVTISITGLS